MIISLRLPDIIFTQRRIVCVHICVCVFMSARMYACVHMHVEAGGQPQVSSSDTLSISFERVSPIGLDCTNQDRLAHQRAPGIFCLTPNPVPQPWDYTHTLPRSSFLLSLCVWGRIVIKLMSPCFQGGCFTDWPVPTSSTGVLLR